MTYSKKTILTLYLLMANVNSIVSGNNQISPQEQQMASNDQKWFDFVYSTGNGKCSTDPGCIRCVNALFAYAGYTSKPSCCSIFERAKNKMLFTSKNEKYLEQCHNEGYRNSTCS